MERASNEPQPANASLREILYARRAESQIADAELIRDYHDGPERVAEAERFVREAMLEFTLGRINDAERSRILEILAFAVPPLPACLANPDPSLWTA